ncbi:MAG: hypothetical protein PHT07_23125 [Paludibacter sp.]|nr:hypothetical protein [Paludibacter sp.]
MPTGFTVGIIEGETFEDFILHCARAFGACVMQRDEPGEIKPKLQKPSDYHKKKITEIESEIYTVKKMSNIHADIEAKKEFTTVVKRDAEFLEKKEIQKKQYETMLEKVKMWIPPTKDHKELKTFMIQQITDSIKFDCLGYDLNTPTAPLNGEIWKRKKLCELQRNLTYHIKEDKAEEDRINNRNVWLQELYNSIGLVPEPEADIKRSDKR